LAEKSILGAGGHASRRSWLAVGTRNRRNIGGLDRLAEDGPVL